MGMPVTSYDDFQKKLSNLKGLPSLLVFLLHMSSPSQEAIARFVHHQGGYIDEVARSMGTYLFYPLRKEGQEFKNPTPGICRIFQIDIKELPGFLIFPSLTIGGRFQSRQAAFLPLEPADFENFDLLEDLFEALIDLVRWNLSAAQGPIDITGLAQSLSIIERKQGVHRFFHHLRKGAKVFLVEFPEKLAIATAESFAKTIGEKMASRM